MNLTTTNEHYDYKRTLRLNEPYGYKRTLRLNEPYGYKWTLRLQMNLMTTNALIKLILKSLGLGSVCIVLVSSAYRINLVFFVAILGKSFKQKKTDQELNHVKIRGWPYPICKRYYYKYFYYILILSDISLSGRILWML